jgi:hypothetical protein
LTEKAEPAKNQKFRELLDKPGKANFWSRLTNGGVSDMPDYIYNLYEAKTRLSHLVDRAAKGEEILIAKSGVPLAKLETQT